MKKTKGLLAICRSTAVTHEFCNYCWLLHTDLRAQTACSLSFGQFLPICSHSGSQNGRVCRVVDYITLILHPRVSSCDLVSDFAMAAFDRSSAHLFHAFILHPDWFTQKRNTFQSRHGICIRSNANRILARLD